jgi:hypothetical protein
MAFARQRERIALGRVEIAEQASDWFIDIEIDMHPVFIDQTFTSVQAKHLTDQEFAPGPEDERDMLSTLERKRRGGQPRHGDIDRRQRR